MATNDQPNASRRTFLAGTGSAIAVGAAVTLSSGTDALAQSATASLADLHGAAPTRYQDIGGVRLAYRRFGKEGAPPVVCLQHFAGTMNSADPIHTNRLAQERPVVLVDYRGVGRSEGQTPDSVRGLAADIIAFIRALGLSQVDVFGFSLGGFVAQQVALDSPSLLRRLLLVGTGPSGGEGMQEYTPQVTEIISRPNVTGDQRRQELFFAPSTTSQAAGRAWLARTTARQSDREPDPKPQAVQAQFAAITQWGRIPKERYAELKKITQRTLVVNGGQDIMVPTVNSFILQQQLPDARLNLFPDSGHGAHFQYPQEFAEAAARFLDAP
ncbi:alpha/beta hydrolase [Variovorax sp. J22G21]|nr:alpha/beta hydrolase [Variovorax sp. J22G21]MDM0064818.1 alpha/beta hydrolase [Variovorax sp. J22G21]